MYELLKVLLINLFFKQGTPKSILDKLAFEDKAILDMIDRGTKSDALRDEPIVEETKAHSTIISPFWPLPWSIVTYQVCKSGRIFSPVFTAGFICVGV